MEVAESKYPRGHYYISFGKEYDKCTAFSVKRLREFSALPVQVVTNLKKKDRHFLWESLDGIIFTEVQMKDDENRLPKCQPDLFSIFDQTLYTDSDTLIHSKQFIQAFDVLDGADMGLIVCSKKDSVERYHRTKVYKQAVNDFKPKEISRIFQAGVMSFRKNIRTRKLFQTWYDYWYLRKLRDMPALVCAVGNCPDLVYTALPHGFGFSKSKIIQHFNGKHHILPKLLPNFLKSLVKENEEKWFITSAFRESNSC